MSFFDDSSNVIGKASLGGAVSSEVATFGTIFLLLLGSAIEIADSMGFNSGESAGFAALAGGLGISFAATGEDGSSESSESGEVIDIWKGTDGKWHINDVVPYSSVEAKAAHIYDMLHPHSEDRSMTFPAFIVENESSAKSISEIFGCNNSDAISTKLNVFETILKSLVSEEKPQ